MRVVCVDDERVIAKEMEGFVVSGDEEEEGEENKSESKLMRSSFVHTTRI